MVAAVVNIQEIHHLAYTDTVEEVGKRAAKGAPRPAMTPLTLTCFFRRRRWPNPLPLSPSTFATSLASCRA